MKSLIDNAYMAALIDGEGCISATAKPGKKSYQLRVNVSNTSLALMAWITDHYGGGVSKTIPKTTPARPRKPSYWWYCTGGMKGIRELLKAVLPYLVIKKRQAELCLAFIELSSKDGRRGQIAKEISALNSGAAYA